MKALRVALFVEGSHDPKNFFEKLWKQELVAALGLRKVDHVFPISKKHLVAMDPTNPPMSGAGEPLDQFIKRKLESNPFDAAVIAWDLMPAWAGGPACRWQETKDLYWFLGMSAHLPEEWSWWSALKYVELRDRPSPGARSRAPQFENYAALAICMEPVFEGLVAASEDGVRKALGVKGKKVKGWPKGWSNPKVTRPETELLQPALRAARALRPPPAEVQKIRGDLRTAKHEWGAYLVQSLVQDPKFQSHSIARRLSEVLKK